MVTYILVALGNSGTAVDAAVTELFPTEERHQLEPGKWLISSSLVTSKDVSDRLALPASEVFIICPIRGYFGRARSDIWEWLGAKSTAKV